MSKKKIEDEELKDNVEGSESEKLVDEENPQDVEENSSASEITLEQFKNALENNIECKGYFDSLSDKTVNTRLDKGIESWKTNNLENILNEEINKRYPQKSETEIELEKTQEEKKQLELKIQYQNLMAENHLPMELLNFVSGENLEETVNKLEKFNNIIGGIIEQHRQAWVNEWMKEGSYVPPGDNGSPNDYSQDIWKMMQ